jgi:hypothetical protein
MRATEQNNLEHILDLLQQGKISTDEANVMKVRYDRIAVVSRLSKDVRRALNNAVAAGELGRIKKDGIKPEVYFHPNFEFMACAEREKAARKAAEAIRSVCG